MVQEILGLAEYLQDEVVVVIVARVKLLLLHAPLHLRALFVLLVLPQRLDVVLEVLKRLNLNFLFRFVEMLKPRGSRATQRTSCT